ncbi:MAG TPA: glycosyltransferase family 39 protein [Candidatus Anoxymicrobiaceae bacterium]
MTGEADLGSSDIKKRKWTSYGWTALVVLSVVLFLALRLRNVGHLLMWDEAQFSLAIKSFSLGLKDVWAPYLNVHPPLYSLMSLSLLRLFGGGAKSYEVVSIIFSTGTLIVTYFLAKTLFNKRVAALAALFLAVLPAAIVLDTWVKQDPTAGFFAVLAVLLFFKKRYVWAGLAMGLGMLTKETAIFALAALFFFAVFTWSRERIKGSVIVGAIAAVMSFWWYVFLSSRVGHFWDFFTGTTVESKMFAKPWYYYFRGLPYDAGWIVTILLVIGLAYSVYRWFNGNKDYALPVIWFLFTYAFLTLSAGKPFWMVPAAFPALAMLAGVGGIALFDCATRRLRASGKARSTLQVAAVCVLALALVLQAGFMSYSGYIKSRDAAAWATSELALSDATLLKKEMGPGQFVFAVYFGVMDRNAAFTYYVGNENVYPLAQAAIDHPEVVVDGARKTHNPWVMIDLSLDEKYRQTSQQVRVFRFIDQLARQAHAKLIRQSGNAIILKLINI